MRKNEMGLVFGSFLAIIHAVWLVLVALIPGGLQAFLNWIIGLHGMAIAMLVTSVTWGGAITLIVLTFVIGYVMGWVFGWIVRKVRK
jgi:ribose/xylose/arabinose/galactoside ABC-type transport system permease subunit